MIHRTLPVVAAIAALLSAGCVSRHTPPPKKQSAAVHGGKHGGPHIMTNGGVISINNPPYAGGGTKGRLQVLHEPPSNQTNHPTQWKYRKLTVPPGGAWLPPTPNGLVDPNTYSLPLTTGSTWVDMEVQILPQKPGDTFSQSPIAVRVNCNTTATVKISYP